LQPIHTNANPILNSKNGDFVQWIINDDKPVAPVFSTAAALHWNTIFYNWLLEKSSTSALVIFTKLFHRLVLKKNKLPH